MTAAIVTGSASGIGRATTLRLAADGYVVAAVDVDEEANAATVERVAAAGGNAFSYVHDLSADDFDGVRDDFVDRVGRIDALINNAGIGVAETVLTTDRKTWDRVLGTNLTAVYETCRSVIPHMVDAGSGMIVNVASVGGMIGLRSRAAYCASKAGVIGLTRAIAVDHAADGIRANAMAPGTVETEWIGKILEGSDDPEALRRDMEARQLDGRMGKPEEVAAGIAFLISREGRFVNGSVFVMDGGITAA